MSKDETSKELQKLNIGPALSLGESSKEVSKLIRNLKQKGPVHAVICDMSPLRIPRAWVVGGMLSAAREEMGQNDPELAVCVGKELKKLNVPLIQVDAHNVVPVWEASDKQETGARTLRPKIKKMLKASKGSSGQIQRMQVKGQPKLSGKTAPFGSFVGVDMLLPPIGERGKGDSRSPSRSPSPGPEPAERSSFKATQLKKQIKAKFHELDVNKDGALSLEELTTFLCCLSSKLTKDDVYEIFRRMDRNRDELVQFDEFVDFIFTSDMDKNPRLLADVEAAAQRQEGHVMDLLEKNSGSAHKERALAQKAGRERLGQLHGSYSFSWQMDEEMESVLLELSSDGSYKCQIVSQLGVGMTDTETSKGAWEVSATEHELLLYKEGSTGTVQRLRLDDFGDLDLGTEGALSKQRWLLRRDGYLD
ncbi:unnamed protein product [Cladocopium goreaui]|uniref:Deoxyribodipyrimidine photo-lyase n=1 Tax=Cladocopium goreaui TaxID=2562237 RepID=A0A9P1C4K5_9DINO|nr:unnamed protein product [Cladocopium goreaui]